jgi:hypothetical protein
MNRDATGGSKCDNLRGWKDVAMVVAREPRICVGIYIRSVQSYSQIGGIRE